MTAAVAARPWYASNAKRLLEDRQRGELHSGVFVVTMADKGLFGDVTQQCPIYVHDHMPVERLDWRMLVDLTVWVWATPAVALSRVLTTVDRIARARPKDLLLRFEDNGVFHDVDVGDGFHRNAVLDLPGEHAFVWSPINSGATVIGKRLTTALCGVHRIGSRL